MSCPNYCSNNFKIKNIPDEIECVVASKVATNSTDPSGVLLDLPSFGNLKRIVTGVSGGPVEIGADPSAILVAIENGELITWRTLYRNSRRCFCYRRNCSNRAIK